MKLQPLTRIRPHYLLELAVVELLSEDGEPLEVVPDWVQESLQQAPFVVVRRGTLDAKLIPVGVRGRVREHRFAAFVRPSSVRRYISPSDLLAVRLDASPVAGTKYGVLEALEALKELWTGIDRPWGPGGSAGFELASGLPTITQSSDLDIVIYADRPVAIHKLRALSDKLSALDTTIDVQVETGYCGFSLSEYCREHPNPILLKTPLGPLMASDPWVTAPEHIHPVKF